ncbi:hypothetical protein HELRODRAFT_182855 [Helobdella robusta]|uniref:Uncharacterized protein n=1 Tax=Helobdella robusta TaxID=6412 RepID=T1FIV4_HELRO|nr:hypothetical protein HELRODRAFT_182855 [Helobdella robusta]ESN90063.1 hypothetical protein HELRODRAFT_182855 [Helobdella robusta]
MTSKDLLHSNPANATSRSDALPNFKRKFLKTELRIPVECIYVRDVSRESNRETAYRWFDVGSARVIFFWPGVAARNKKRPRLNNSPETNQPNPAITSNKLESSKLPTKIVGAKKNDNNKLSADKKLIKKSVFAMSNIKKCSRSNVIDYLSEVGIQVISCYPVLKRSLAPSGTLPRNEGEDSTMFRVCINASDTSKIQDPDNLPENVIIREWRFLNSKSGQTTSTNNG